MRKWIQVRVRVRVSVRVRALTPSAPLTMLTPLAVKFNKMMQQFSMANEKMETASEMMDDLMDEVRPSYCARIYLPAKIHKI